MKVIGKQKVGIHTIVMKSVNTEEIDKIAEEDVDTGNTIGYYKRDKDGTPVIYIHEDLKGLEREVIVNHELMEAVNALYDFELNHTSICILGEVLTELKNGLKISGNGEGK